MSEREYALRTKTVSELLDILANSEDQSYADLAWEELHQRDLHGLLRGDK